MTKRSRTRFSTKDEKRIRAELRSRLMGDAEMARFLDALFGVGTWAYDADEDVWVTPDTKHSGPGRVFIVVERGGNWFKAILPAAETTT
jgi:hypothetical protein